MSELVLSSPAGQEPAIGPDAPIMEVMATMRAMRRLKPDPVPDELLDKLVEAATWAPSASNAQAYHWVVVTDRAQMARLAEAWRECVDEYLALMGTDTPARTAGAEAAAKLREALLYQRDHFAETPAVFVACYKGRQLGPRDPRRLLKIGPRRMVALARGGMRAGTLAEAASVYPAVQNLLLAARAHGLGANITSWHLMREDRFKEILGIPGNVGTYAVIPVGWPQGRFGPVRRRPVAEVTHRDRW